MKNRFFIDAPLIEHQTIEISKEEMRHFKVLRIRNNETIEIINGTGILARARLMSENKLLIEHTEQTPKPTYNSVLLQALPEGSHLDVLIEKGCELGVTHFILFPSKRSIKQDLSPNKRTRISNILISALKQSKQLYLPKVSIVESISKTENLPTNLYLADPSGEPLLATPKEDCGFIVGPESGFTREEIDYFTQKLHAKKVSLSQNILRCETASIVSAFLLSQKN